VKLVAAIVGVIVLLLATPVNAIIDPPPKDESKPKLVKVYIFMPCEALELSYAFQHHQLKHLFNHLKNCRQAATDNPDYEYGPLMCVYVQMQWQYMMDHIKSVEKAYHLMCDDEGYAKDQQYEIDF
jgi:hypothetical protein